MVVFEVVFSGSFRLPRNVDHGLGLRFSSMQSLVLRLKRSSMSLSLSPKTVTVKMDG